MLFESVANSVTLGLQEMKFKSYMCTPHKKWMNHRLEEPEPTFKVMYSNCHGPDRVKPKRQMWHVAQVLGTETNILVLNPGFFPLHLPTTQGL